MDMQWPVCRFKNRFNMAPVCAVAIGDNICFSHWQAGQRCHAVISLNAVFCDMGIPELVKQFFWKTVIGAFGFLQANDVRLRLGNKFFHKRGAQAHRIDIPRDNAHDRLCPFVSVQKILSVWPVRVSGQRPAANSRYFNMSGCDKISDLSSDVLSGSSAPLAASTSAAP